MFLANGTSPLLFGDTSSLLRWLILAVGAALFVGNVLALVRPPTRLSTQPSTPSKSTPSKPASASGATEESSKSDDAPDDAPDDPPNDAPVVPRGRIITMAILGLVVTIWAIGSLALS